MKQSTVSYENIKIDADVNMRYSCCTDYGYFVPVHWHDSMEILYILDGDSIINLEQQSFLLAKGDFIIIDSKVIHSTCTRSYSYFLIIQIPYQFLKDCIPDIDYIHFENISSVSGIPISEGDAVPAPLPNVEILSKLRSILDGLATLWNNKSDGYQLKYYSYIYELLYLMMTHFKIDISQMEYRPTEKYMERLTTVISYVKQHYREDISLRNTADYLALNPSYFTRFFKKYMNMTFMEYVNTIRLRYIYEDIIATDLPIQTILERNGFTNYKLFMRLFRQTYGCTPSQKRKEISVTSGGDPAGNTSSMS